VRVDDNTKFTKWQSRHILPVERRNFPRYNDKMNWIYLSPHFDDVALSCGGLVWEEAQRGEKVSIWTVCAGEPPSAELSPFARELHARWKLDQNAPSSSRYLPISDCIYRRHPTTGEYLYHTEAALNGTLQAGDDLVIQSLQDELIRSQEPDSSYVSPLGLGNHVDHQHTRHAAESFGRTLWYYADYPYVIRNATLLEQMEMVGWASQVFPISQAGLMAWTDSISAHASQVSTFWANDQAMRLEVAGYLHANGGIRLWRKLAE
jgi:LmbE family N-acetylglucosaminyl deacetylase